METLKANSKNYKFLFLNFFSLRDACRQAGIFFIFLFITFPVIFVNNLHAQEFQKERNIMVRNQIKARGIQSEAVIEAMSKVPRHRFVPKNVEQLAYSDRPLPIGHEQTISQPFIVGYMTETLNLNPGDKVLEIGTGSGYQAAILAEMGMVVYTIEIIPELAQRAEENLQSTGYSDVNVKHGNGYKGWPEEAPFDAVIITAAPEEIPQALVRQMKTGGTMIVPVGPVGSIQSLKKIIKKKDGITESTLMPVRFVPMIKKRL